MFFKWVPPKPLLKRNWRLANAHAALFLKQKSFNLPFKIEVSLFSFGIAPLIFYLIGAPIFVFMKKKMMFSAPFSSTWHINLDGGKKRQKLAPKCITNNLGQPTLFGAYFIVNIYSVLSLVFPQPNFFSPYNTWIAYYAMHRYHLFYFLYIVKYTSSAISITPWFFQGMTRFQALYVSPNRGNSS